MFTGIIEQVGEVSNVEQTGQGRLVTVRGEILAGLGIGASVAVDGVCLTAAGVEGSQVTVDVVPETLERTTLGALAVGDLVNLERPMPASGRFDGHIVQGHVDGVGTVESVVDEGGGVIMTVVPPSGLLGQIVEKGSIAVDGVSLTVAGMNERAFRVALIPHTLKVTTLGLRKAGDAVNLESDVIAKYVERMMRANE